MTPAAEAIETPRLRLLPLRVADAEELALVLADPALHTFIGGAPAEVQTVRARFARWVVGSPDPAVTWANWGIQLRAEECLVGTVQATISGSEAEVAWTVGTGWQGRGIAGEAARGLVGWLRGHGVDLVLAHIHPDHAASARVAAAAGLAATDRLVDGEVEWRLSLVADTE
ncbi:MAG TPA: GNAT family N-acetyltransferase [Pseudonocardiaceae bacterium]|jgi:RimJ/RimL family protein N-acetyltransferase|nr:GNAT family N-acetyltransferase [Pseudonocardiaceae bacterium]